MTSISNAKMSVNSWTPTVENPEPIPPIILHSCNYTRIKKLPRSKAKNATAKYL